MEEPLVVRRPAVAGTFYPAEPARLAALVSRLLEEADRRAEATLESSGSTGRLRGLLVPHAGLQYSGPVAAAAWRLLRAGPQVMRHTPPTIVLVGTCHLAWSLDGIAVWDGGPWRLPTGMIAIDDELARAVLELGAPFIADLPAHRDEHSIEVQLPFLQTVTPDARIVPLVVSARIGERGRDAGARLGELLAALGAERETVVVISSDMAHYPGRADAESATRTLAPAILRIDPDRLVQVERDLVRSGVRGLACGMCGTHAAIVGLAALRASGATHGVELAEATSADADGSPHRTVGYLAVEFR